MSSKPDRDPADRVLCLTPTPGKRPTTVPRWKFEAVRRAILEVFARHPDGVEFKVLPELVREALPEGERKDLGSIAWHVTTVKLHLEVEGEIERVAGRSPQLLRRVGT